MNDRPQDPTSQYFINGYTVYFPEGRKPFPAQLSVISKVLQALKEKKNALLESPTGTGKTLALLSSTLAFQHSFRNTFESVPLTSPHQPQQAAGKVNKEKGLKADLYEKPESGNSLDTDPEGEYVEVSLSVPKVFYCTRTHSQLQQVADEFRNCHPTYTKQARMCILGSRSHLCINREAKNEAKQPGKSLDEVCQDFREHHQCHFIRKPEKLIRTVHALNDLGIWDIEDAVEAGKKHQGCPYYATKELFESAKYILSPYNYILDPGIRKATKMPIRNSILIFDEAHNIEDIAREGASMDVQKKTLELAIIELGKAKERGSHSYCGTLSQLCQDLKAWIEEMAEDLYHGKGGWVVGAGEGGAEGAAGSAQGATSLVNKFRTPAHRNTTQRSTREGFQGNQSHGDDELPPWDGEEFLYIMDTRYGLNDRTLPVFAELLERLIDEQETLKEVKEQKQREEEENATIDGEQDFVPLPESSNGNGSSKIDKLIPVISGHTISFLRRYLVILEFMMRNQQCHANDFRIVIQKAKEDSHQVVAQEKKRKSSDAVVVSAKDILPVSFHIWCMNAAVAFEDIFSACHSVILTSGTLSPLDTFSAELGTTFPIKLEANHVVNLSKQLFAGCFTTFLDKSLIATYNAQQSDSYLDLIGQALFMLLRLTPGGLLMFLPSYRLLSRLAMRWRQTGLIAEIEKVLSSPVFFEEKSTDQMGRMLQKYYDTLSEPDSRAALVAVCRGKVSEGINFSDHYARTVVIVGIPFPALFDLQVKLKKTYQDGKAAVYHRHMNNNHQTPGPSSSSYDTFQQTQQTACFSPPHPSSAPTPSIPSSSNAMPLPHQDGNAWYKQQAFRAINQAIGRCIRHRLDFGAILLLDPRFQQDQVVNYLSKWMRPEARFFDKLEDCILDLKYFFSQQDSYATMRDRNNNNQRGKKGKKKEEGVDQEEEMEEGKKKEKKEVKVEKKGAERQTAHTEGSRPLSIAAAFKRMEEEKKTKKEEGKIEEEEEKEETESITFEITTKREEEEEDMAERFQASTVSFSPSSFSPPTSSPSSPLSSASPLPFISLPSVSLFFKNLLLLWDEAGRVNRQSQRVRTELSHLLQLLRPRSLVRIDLAQLDRGGMGGVEEVSRACRVEIEEDTGDNEQKRAIGVHKNEEREFPWVMEGEGKELKERLAQLVQSREVLIGEEWNHVDQVVYQLVYVKKTDEATTLPFKLRIPSAFVTTRSNAMAEYRVVAGKVIATAPGKEGLLYESYVSKYVV